MNLESHVRGILRLLNLKQHHIPALNNLKYFAEHRDGNGIWVQFKAPNGEFCDIEVSREQKVTIVFLREKYIGDPEAKKLVQHGMHLVFKNRDCIHECSSESEDPCNYKEDCDESKKIPIDEFIDWITAAAYTFPKLPKLRKWKDEIADCENPIQIAETKTRTVYIMLRRDTPAIALQLWHTGSFSLGKIIMCHGDDYALQLLECCTSDLFNTKFDHLVNDDGKAPKDTTEFINLQED